MDISFRHGSIIGSKKEEGRKEMGKCMKTKLFALQRVFLV